MRKCWSAPMIGAALCAVGPSFAEAPPGASGIARYLGPSNSLDVPGGVASDRIIVRLKPDLALDLDARLTSKSKVHRSSLAQQNQAWSTLLAAQGALGVEPAVRSFADPQLAASLGLDRYYVVKLPAGTQSRAVASAFAALSDVVEFSQCDAVGGLLDTVPNDAFFSLQCDLDNPGAQQGGLCLLPDADIDAPQAWDISTGSDLLTLAIIDTGVSMSHPDLASKLVPGINTTGMGDASNGDDNVQYSHGTHCAGIAAAIGNNGFGIAGVSWGVRVMPVRVANAVGFTAETWVANGIIAAADAGADVASMSIGLSEGEGLLEAAVQYAHASGMVLCASAGNVPSQPIAFPAAFPEVMAVGAVDSADMLAPFSATGPELSVCAPGVDIFSTWDTALNPNGFAYQSGTSMASPVVAGVACLIWSINPNLSNDEVRQIIESTCDDLGPAGWDQSFGFGRVNANTAVALAYSLMLDCGVDWNHDGQITSQDFFDFMSSFYAGNADANNDGTTDSNDFFQFTAEFFDGACMP